MALHVHLPVRVRLSGRITPRELGLLERAVGDATRTALITARREVLDARGAARPVVVDRPAPEFLGPPLDPEMYERVRAAVGRGLSAGIAAAGLPRPAGPVPGRTGTGAAEPYDATRARPRGRAAGPEGEPLGTGVSGEPRPGSYLLPFYDRGGDPVAVPIVETGTPPPKAAGAPANGGALTLDGALTLAWDAHLYRNGVQWRPEVHGYPGYAGTFLVQGEQRRALAWITHVDGVQPDGTVRAADYTARWQDFQLLRPAGAQGGGPAFQLGTPAFGLEGGQLIRTDRTPTTETVEQTITELLDRERAPRNHPLRDAATLRRYAEQLAAGLPSTYVICSVVGVTRQFALMPGDIESPIRFVTGPAGPTGEPQEAAGSDRDGPAPGEAGKPAPKAKPAPSPEPGVPPADPGQDDTQGDAPGQGPGDEAEGDGGPPGGPVDGPREAGDSGRWPSGTPGGEPLECSPYDGEPELATLRHGGAGLAADIRALAGLLDVPRCGYAGMFALNCARAIAAGAREVGLASVHSTVSTRVKVRGDHGGNNGLLDVRPGQAQELDLLTRLAEAAARVHVLADDVVAAYLHQDNASLVAPDAGGAAGQHAASWALHFTVKMYQALSTACMHLFAETCRVLLLQQLRSSRAAIDQYTGPRAKETQEHFEQVLDVLGASTVRLIVLRRAVRHGERLGATGPVREVLSRKVTQHSAGYAEFGQEESAPVDWVSERTLAELADARVERVATEYWAFHAGRHWTVGEIEAGINARRAVLNRIDPLFLQVGDLEKLFRETAAAPGHAGAYLTGLLAEMAKANTEMSRRASDPRDGAFFALEVSQWVEREGGRDQRGLWFELHGIHALADDHLRRYLGGLAAYADGVNRAIARKAGADQLWHLFTTAGVVVLGLLCAPLGAAAAGLVTGVVGVTAAVGELLHAQEQKQVYRSVLDPEALQHWQDVEMAELMAWIGLAFSVFDVGQVGGGAKAITQGALRELRAAGQQGVLAAARSGLHETRRSIVGNMTRDLLGHALQQAVTNLAVTQAMEHLVPLVIQPVAVSLMRESARLHGTGAELEAALAELEDR